jgi:hypothetical protein
VKHRYWNFKKKYRLLRIEPRLTRLPVAQSPPEPENGLLTGWRKKLMKTLVLLVVLTASSLMAQDDRDSGPSPVPEPATIVLMGVGLAGVGFAAWRKNRKK